MKTWLKVVLGIGAAIAILVALIFWATSGVTRAGDSFFAAIEAGDYDEAYDQTSTGFKADTSREQLENYLKSVALDQVESVSWGGRSVTIGVGDLEGTVTTKDGGTIPITMQFVDENSGWKLQSIRLMQAGIQTGNATMPSESEQVQLVRETNAVFLQSLAGRDFAPLYGHYSQIFRDQQSLEQLAEAFKGILPAAKSLQVTQNMPPIFNGPATINEDGLLVISGYYDTKPNRYTFENTYIFEGLGWKLFGFEVNVVPPSKAAPRPRSGQTAPPQ